MFLSVFGKGLLPRDDVQDFDALKDCKDIPVRRQNTPEVREDLTKIKGNIVNHPSNFLSKVLEPDKFLNWTKIVNIISSRSLSNLEIGQK